MIPGVGNAWRKWYRREVGTIQGGLRWECQQGAGREDESEEWLDQWKDLTQYRKIEERRELKKIIGCTRSARMKERAAVTYAMKNKKWKPVLGQTSGGSWINDLAEEAETAARNNRSGELFQRSWKMAGQGSNMTTIKDKDGKYSDL